MTFPLTVNRVMGLCAFDGANRITAPGINDKKKVGKLFHLQMQKMANVDLPTLYKELAKLVGHEGLTHVEDGRRQIEITLFQETRRPIGRQQLFKDAVIDGEAAREPVVGLFRYHRFHFTVDNVVWDMRVRPSVTACVLESDDRYSKLWWTFEGVPLDPVKNPPDEKSSVAFVSATTKLAELAVPALRKAYARTLQEVTKKNRGEPTHAGKQLRVSLSDNTDVPFSGLIDAMYLDGAPFADAKEGLYGMEPQEGARELESYIKLTSGQEPDPQDILVDTGTSPGTAAAFARPVLDDHAPEGITRHVISGLASSATMFSNGLPTDDAWIQMRNTADSLRSVSAARPLSAMLADQAARELDGMARNAANAPSPA